MIVRSIGVIGKGWGGSGRLFFDLFFCDVGRLFRIVIGVFGVCLILCFVFL